MAERQHCGDPNPHPPHKYYSAVNEKGKTLQKEFQCPGSR